MNSSKKWIFAIVLVLLATNCVFAWGKRDDSGNSNSGSNSSHSLSYTTSSSYGSWIEGATRCNTRSVPAETTWTYSYTFTTRRQSRKIAEGEFFEMPYNWFDITCFCYFLSVFFLSRYCKHETIWKINYTIRNSLSFCCGNYPDFTFIAKRK